jgi:UDP-N-acetylmuramoyl-tripeptide--D-alanyl-D-alanine ligase
MQAIELLLAHFLKHHKVTTDTRKIEPGCIFFALKGANFNGNHFALQAIEQGCAYAVVDESQNSNDNRLLLVPDALEALQSLALAYRRTFNIPVLGITGSNGKTTTKELVRDVLAKKFKVHATLGNLNNHIGVPLTLLSMPHDTEFAVIEMGANHQKEIEGYCKFTEPNYALITNIGKAHLEGFGGIEGVKKGKKELFDFVSTQQGTIFVNTDQPELNEVSSGMKREAFGMHGPGFNLEITNETPALSLTLETPIWKGDMPTKLAGAYNIHNIAAAVKLGIHFGVTPNDICNAIANYTPENNRSQLKPTEHNLLILDAYNANPSSMEHALLNLSKQTSKSPYFIIGDMLELGEEGPAEHQKILNTARALNLEGITVGPIFKACVHSYPAFETAAEARSFLEQHKVQNHTILVKGSRGIRLEQLIDTL